MRQQREATGPSSRGQCLIYADGKPGRPLSALAQISNILEDPKAFVWLDIIDPGPQDFALIAEEFALHPLAVEDAVRAHERPKIEAYGDSWFLVVQAATRQGESLNIHEVAIFVGAQYVVTVRTSPPYPFDQLERRWANLPPSLHRDSGALLYTMLDTIVDGYTLIAEAFEEHVEALESALLGDSQRTNDVLLEIYQMKKDVSRFRRAVVPMRDILTPILRGDLHLFGADEMPYYRDVLDHVALAVDQMDTARELVNNARDTHISMASHRQNEVAKQLTIVATIFLPLTFITGFFGQNFGWMIAGITSPQSFAFWGIGSEFVGLVALLSYFRFKRWY